MANSYDRIFKENIESLQLHLLRKILGANPPKLAPIDAKMQVTQEAEMDNIRRVVHEDSSLDYGLQIEFHVSDEDLRKRNFLHYALFHHITNLPLRQVVIYGGMERGTQIKKNHLSLNGIDLQFEVIVLRKIPKELFLNSKVPEEVILAILCDFGEDSPDQVVESILGTLTSLLKRSNRIKKYQKQLFILSRLRKMELIVKTQVEAMTIHYDIETDGLYLQGVEEGIEQGIELGIEKGIEQGIELERREFIQTLWSLQEFPLDKIAMVVKSPVEQVIEVLVDLLKDQGLSDAEASEKIELYQAKFS
jgi:uncharacterized protein YwgA